MREIAIILMVFIIAYILEGVWREHRANKKAKEARQQAVIESIQQQVDELINRGNR